jgi:hypothetical protein
MTKDAAAGLLTSAVLGKAAWGGVLALMVYIGNGALDNLNRATAKIEDAARTIAVLDNRVTRNENDIKRLWRAPQRWNFNSPSEAGEVPQLGSVEGQAPAEN